jgi:hypothetical protein
MSRNYQIKLGGENMADLYGKLKKKSGRNCYTLARNNPARMEVDDTGVKVTYPSGLIVFLPAAMVKEAIRRLLTNGELDVDEIHQQVTHLHRTRTDKLMAVLREIPGVTFTPLPKRILYYRHETK